MVIKTCSLTFSEENKLEGLKTKRSGGKGGQFKMQNTEFHESHGDDGELNMYLARIGRQEMRTEFWRRNRLKETTCRTKKETGA
jgi:hypothetical protein